MKQGLFAEKASSGQLAWLTKSLAVAAGFAEVVASLTAGHGATLDGVWGSSCALVAATLAKVSPGPLLVICPSQDDSDDFCQDLGLFSERIAFQFPAWEERRTAAAGVEDAIGQRLKILKALSGELPPTFVVASIQALQQPVPAQPQLATLTRRLSVGSTCDLESLVKWLVEQGFQASTAVELPGEFSRRGGILDLFAIDWEQPVRVELFGDQVDSIRRFEPATQRSLTTLTEIELTAWTPSPADRASLLDWLPPASWILLHEPGHLAEEGRFYLTRVDRPEDFLTVDQILAQVYQFPSVTASNISTASLETTCRLKIESVERFSGDIAKVRDELDEAGRDQSVHIVCITSGEGQRLSELFADTRLAAAGRLQFHVGRLSEGFRLVPERIVLVSGAELFQRLEIARPSRRRLGRVIDSFLELREGDYVVHLSHGIGRYRGLKQLSEHAQTEEHLELEFHGGTRIYVPVAKIELVQKYVGGSKSRPSLAHIGGRTWGRQKEAAERSVLDMAAELLELQAARGSRPGIAFAAESEWQREFEAAFPYLETADQMAGISAIQRDMLAPRPMDRLICGDVGYGKTELAMRAAFKAVDSGYQVAVLVPTTVLAEQHGRSFRDRMGEYPFSIDVLSRFCTATEQRRILKRLADGSLDLVIGTHRLAQPDLKFQNLGLVIIDEEQRFGVAVKERLKAYRQTVDVLTLTATPIPRTLHMSLLGLRDISNLETPPAERLAVETRVAPFDAELIRHAVLRELARGGQMFFVHNKVHDIQEIAWRLGQIVPEARLAIGHGQMAEGELETVMLDFVHHRFDLLLATTIVESGLDIPNANTIFIDQADQYGLADLHQLRGRVGRYKHRAYCYLLLDPGRPLSPTSQRRLAAIQEFSEMGAGFAIAMRDLEIRGAGNILGTEQSGHISAVGYELYCELLEKTVRRLKQLPPKVTVEVNVSLPGETFLPRSYVPELRLKVDLYRRLARVATFQELEEFRAELVDRFGPLPEAAVRLVERMELRLCAQTWQIEAIHLEDKYAVLTYQSRPRIEQLVRQCGRALRIVDDHSAYLPLGGNLRSGDDIQRHLKALLQPPSASVYTPAALGASARTK